MFGLPQRGKEAEVAKIDAVLCPAADLKVLATPKRFYTAEQLNSGRLDCGTESRRGGLEPFARTALPDSG